MGHLHRRPHAAADGRPANPRRSGSAWLVTAILLAAVAAACARNPVTGSRELVFMSESQEADLGRQADAQIRGEMGVYEDAALQEYVAAVGNELAAASHRPDLPWQFTVIDSPVVNAFAVPGGYVYLTRGLLAHLNDEAELAGVLGHEIGHVTARHSVQAYSRAAGAQMGLLLGQIFVPGMRPRYGAPGPGRRRRAGARAPVSEVRTRRRASGGSPWRRVCRCLRLGSSWRGRHADDAGAYRGTRPTAVGRPTGSRPIPEPLDRVAGVAGTVETLLAETDDLSALRVDRAGYLARIEGIVYGDNPEQGVVRGPEFLHPALRFALEFPVGWEVHNGAEVVVAREPGQDRYMLLQIAEETGYDLQRTAERGMAGTGFVEVQGTTSEINGLDAYVGTYTQDVRGVGPMIARVAFIRSRFLGISARRLRRRGRVPPHRARGPRQPAFLPAVEPRRSGRNPSEPGRRLQRPRRGYVAEHRTTCRGGDRAGLHAGHHERLSRERAAVARRRHQDRAAGIAWRRVRRAPGGAVVPCGGDQYRSEAMRRAPR